MSTASPQPLHDPASRLGTTVPARTASIPAVSTPPVPSAVRGASPVRCSRFALFCCTWANGSGWRRAQQTRLGGTFNAAIYVSSVIGGVIADRWLGTQGDVARALLLALGYAVLSMDRETLLHPAAGLLMMGHGLFKPSISSAVGKLYPRNDPRRDDAYSLFYVVFNIGSGCGPVAGGFLRSHLGWSAAFAVAGLAMLAALAVRLFAFASWAKRLDQIQTHRQARAKIGIGRHGQLPHCSASSARVYCSPAVYEQSGQSLLLWARDCSAFYAWVFRSALRVCWAYQDYSCSESQPLLSRTQNGAIVEVIIRLRSRG